MRLHVDRQTPRRAGELASSAAAASSVERDALAKLDGRWRCEMPTSEASGEVGGGEREADEDDERERR